MADRTVVADAWRNWSEVPRHAAERLTESYLQAYYERDDPGDIASPDVLLILALFGRVSGSGEKTPPFRRQQFFACLRTSCSPGGRSLGADEMMLEALLDPRSVTPEAFADASIRLLSTTNSLSRFLMLRVEPKSTSTISEELWLARSGREFNPAITMMLRTNDKEDGPYATRLRQAWPDYLRNAPRPLPEPLRVQLRHHLGHATLRGILEASLREEDGVLPPPPQPAPTPPGAASATRAPKPAEWPVEWLPFPLKRNPDVKPVLVWVNDGVLYQALLQQYAVKIPSLMVIGCRIGSSQWSTGIRVGDVLAQASAVQALGEYEFFRANGRSFLTSKWKTWRIEPNGALTAHALLPPCAGKWSILLESGNGVVFAEGKARIRYWDATTDSIIDLANHASTEPGPLNNQPAWTVIGLHPGPLPGRCDAVVLASEPLAKSSGSTRVMRHISLDCAARNVELVCSVPGLADPNGRSISTPEALFVPGDPGYRSQAPGWYRIPRDLGEPSLQLTEADIPTSIAASARRAFSNRQYGPPAERSDLRLRDGLTANSTRVVDVKGARVATPKLRKVGEDLVIFDRLDTGLQIIRDAFTRELPPEGTDIQLREVEFRSR
jgi:hypothetical protein